MPSTLLTQDGEAADAAARYDTAHTAFASRCLAEWHHRVSVFLFAALKKQGSYRHVNLKAVNIGTASVELRRQARLFHKFATVSLADGLVFPDFQTMLR